MQIAVISDLHLGAGDQSDAFGHSDEHFLSFLNQLEQDFDRIVLLGDIWETLTSHRPFSAAEGLRRARDAHASIARRFLSRKYTYVHGNHDLVAARIDAAPSEWVLDSDGIRLLFTHGHHHDWLIRRARWLSESLVWLGAWARRLGFESVYRFGYWLDAWLSGSTDEPALGRFALWALRLAEAHTADVVIAGHTHVTSSVQHRGRLYLNSGTCSEGRWSYLALDTKAGQYDVCEVRNQG
ncbi:MAG TPA: metallophosphoesterase family protein [Polyangiaceae bacterium]|nr:metallophosphoesterase family protein [Polyangiaceae bacterium]